jgi:membrane associated rhomboid family serine protease
VFTRRALEILLGVVVLVVFGVTLLYDLVPHTGISWQAHLFGAIGGVIAASLLSERARALPGTRMRARLGVHAPD